jgi:ParB family chromosome partitioning protein
MGGTLEHLDPTRLVLGDNVREYPNVNNPFLDSIAEHGVLVPITAIRRPDGAVKVCNGSRRTVAARKLGLSSVPVYVLPATAANSTFRCALANPTDFRRRQSPTRLVTLL